jgi:UPF0716 family protein affecting phage T7 exclusion
VPDHPVKPAAPRRKRSSLIRLVSGWVLTVAGLILMIPLVPGPGFVLVFGGVALLSSESRFIRNLIRRHREKRLIKRALREAERVGLKINLDADLDVADEEVSHPDRATGSRR